MLWILSHGDVNPSNTVALNHDSVRLTDFDSAEFAPALTDIAMTRMRWPGARSQMLGPAEAAPVLTGYHRVCPLSKEEVVAWSVLAGVYYMERTAFLLHRRLYVQKGQQHEAERLRGALTELSKRAVEMGDELLQASGIATV